MIKVQDLALEEAVNACGKFLFGRYRSPIATPSFEGAILSDCPGWWGRPTDSSFGRMVRSFRLKEWHYHSIVNDDYFLAFAVAQLGYAANVFLYLVERKTGKLHEYETLLPLGIGVAFAPSSVRGATVWRRERAGICMTYEPVDGGRWRCDLEVPLDETWLRGSLLVMRDEAMALLYPLHKNRGAYTHKEAGNRAGGALMFGERPIEFQEDSTFAALDWTRSFANRRTEWNWLCIAGLASDGRRVGMNLSARVYDDQENTLWVDGVASPLGAATFDVPENTMEPWRIRGDAFELVFRPQGERRQNTDLVFVESQFVQPYGAATGDVLAPDGTRLVLNRVFGVVEDHVAVW